MGTADNHSDDIGGSVLTVDLDAIVDNYKLLQGKAAGVETAAVVKADAYGLGAAKVAPTLATAGCRTFFVATLDEAVALRIHLPDAAIHVFNGLLPGWSETMADIMAIPVLNSLYQVNLWIEHQEALGKRLAADLHIDTGMSRLGLGSTELALFNGSPDLKQALDLDIVLSHLACADEPDHPHNPEQRQAFALARQSFDGVRTSLAASSGIFLGSEFHLDLVRPGIALYGGNPTPGEPNPMAQVIRFQGKILQVRSVDTPQTVGYGATHQASGPSRIATVAAGYADGLLRSLGNRGKAWVEAHEVPVVGRVSMDLTTIDVTGIPDYQAVPGALVDFIGPRQSVDDLARDAGTISYEILTGLGSRTRRCYSGANP